MPFCSVLGSTIYFNEKTHYSSKGRAVLHHQPSYFLLEMKQGDIVQFGKCGYSTLTPKPLKFCVKAGKFLKSSCSKFKQWDGVISVYRLGSEQIDQKES